MDDWVEALVLVKNTQAPNSVWDLKYWVLVAQMSWNGHKGGKLRMLITWHNSGKLMHTTCRDGAVRSPPKAPRSAGQR